MGGASIEIDAFTWRPFGRQVPVLDRFDLSVRPGEHVLLAGPSGCGKSTLLRAIAGALAAQGAGVGSGSVRVDGRAPEDAVTGLLVQDPRDAAVAETIGRDTAFGLENRGVARGMIWGRVRDALAAVHLPQPPTHAVRALSGGEAQRLALAGVLVLDPALVLLDEPTSMLDPAAARAVREAVTEAVTASGATMVVVEHEPEPWLPLIDRVVALGPNGSVLADGAPDIVFATHGAALTEAGVWVPRAPAPRPGPFDARLLAPVHALAPGAVALRAEAVSVDRLDQSPIARGTRPRVVRTVRGVDATVRAGRILAIVGPSGAGKSTVSAVLAGLDAPTAGTVRSAPELAVDGEDRPAEWSAADISARIGWVPQDAELSVLGASVRDDVLVAAADDVPGASVGSDRIGREARVGQILEMLGLDRLASADPHQLSGGEQRRLALAGAIAQRPAVLVLDEPTVGQDRRTWSAVTGLMMAAREAGVAVVVTSHDARLVALADDVLRLDRGSAVVERSDATTTPATTPSAPAATDTMGSHTMTSPPHPPLASAAVPAAATPGLALRCGPLSLLGAATLLVVGAIGVHSALAAAAGILCWLAISPFVTRGVRMPARRLLPGAIAVVSVGFSSWLLGSTHDPLDGAAAGLRIAFFVVPGVWLAGFVEPSALGAHLAQRLHLPARPVVAATAALQQFDRLVDDWRQLRAVRRIRGVAAGRNPGARVREFAGLTFALLVQSLRTAARMSVAMDARGFSAAQASGFRRSWAEPAPWRRSDTIMLLLGALVAAVPAMVGAVLT